MSQSPRPSSVTQPRRERVLPTWIDPNCHLPLNQMRDLRAIGTKVVQVLHPSSDNAVLREWDLWGPLIVSIQQVGPH